MITALIEWHLEAFFELNAGDCGSIAEPMIFFLNRVMYNPVAGRRRSITTGDANASPTGFLFSPTLSLFGALSLVLD